MWTLAQDSSLSSWSAPFTSGLPVIETKAVCHHVLSLVITQGSIQNLDYSVQCFGVFNYCSHLSFLCLSLLLILSTFLSWPLPFSLYAFVAYLISFPNILTIYFDLWPSFQSRIVNSNKNDIFGDWQIVFYITLESSSPSWLLKLLIRYQPALSSQLVN